MLPGGGSAGPAASAFDEVEPTLDAIQACFDAVNAHRKGRHALLYMGETGRQIAEADLQPADTFRQLADPVGKPVDLLVVRRRYAGTRFPGSSAMQA